MECFSCGKDIANNAKFCRYCSASQATRPSAIACKKCGIGLSPKTKFCRECGEKVGQLDTISVAVIAPINEPKPQSSPLHTNPARPIAVVNPNFSADTISSEKTGITGLHILIGVASIALLGAIIFFAKSNNNAVEPKDMSEYVRQQQAKRQVAELEAAEQNAEAIAQKSGVRCSDVLHGSENYHKKMEELAILAKLPNSYFNRYVEDVVSNLCEGNMENVNSSIDYGAVKSIEVKAIIKVLMVNQPDAEKMFSELLTEENRSEAGKRYSFSYSKLMLMGLCTACAGNVAHFYANEPESDCGVLATLALEGDPNAISELQADSPPAYCTINQ